MKKIMSFLLAVCFVLPLLAQRGIESPADAHAPLKHLPNVNDLPPHPRILMLAGEEQHIKANMAADPVWNKMHQLIIEESEKILLVSAVKYRLDGRRLLSVSRRALSRIFYLSYAYRMTGQEKYAKRAEKEMLAAAAFSDWNPAHFLDVAEMTMAMSIGYDWLYSQLSPSSRETIKSAILNKGIEPSLNSQYNGWLKGSSNWNQVCNAGMAFGALAIFEDMSEFSKMIIDRSLESIRIPMHEYAPDGAYPEGYSYWIYGTNFNVMFLSAIEKIWGTDFALTQIPGFMKTTAFMLNMTGPTGLVFNHSDMKTEEGSLLLSMFWFASKTSDKSVLWEQRTYMKTAKELPLDRLLPAIMLWGSDIRIADIESPKELIWVGRGTTPVALMRTSWRDPHAIYVGMKGGKASSSHAHMDAGSFIMEADGIRWASDFGRQGYTTLEKRGFDLWNRQQNSQRWQLFRYSNYAHNTLTVNNQLHLVDGAADIVSWSSTADFMNAILDMSKLFEGALKQCFRGIAIVNGEYVAVRDEVAAADKEATVRWTMLTSAEAKIKGKNSIELTKEGKKLTLQVTEPANVTMQTWSTVPPSDYDAPNPGTILVGFEVTIPAGTSTALTVKLIPQKAKNTGAEISALQAWEKGTSKNSKIKDCD